MSLPKPRIHRIGIGATRSDESSILSARVSLQLGSNWRNWCNYDFLLCTTGFAPPIDARRFLSSRAATQMSPTAWGKYRAASTGKGRVVCLKRCGARCQACRQDDSPQSASSASGARMFRTNDRSSSTTRRIIEASPRTSESFIHGARHVMGRSGLGGRHRLQPARSLGRLQRSTPRWIRRIRPEEARRHSQHKFISDQNECSVEWRQIQGRSPARRAWRRGRKPPRR